MAAVRSSERRTVREIEGARFAPDAAETPLMLPGNETRGADCARARKDGQSKAAANIRPANERILAKLSLRFIVAATID